MSNKCYIFGAGDYGKMKLTTENVRDGYIIAADAGLKYLQSYGIAPNLIIGDFDSTGFIPDDANTIVLPKEKDDTDMLAAIKIGIEKGLKEFCIYGGLGGRIDHTIANIQSLEYLNRHGGHGWLISDNTVIAVIENESLHFKSGYTGTVSVFSLGDSCRSVGLRGLKYELNNAEISCSFPIGVSNEFTNTESSVSIEDGKLIVIWEYNDKNLSLGLLPERKNNRII